MSLNNKRVINLVDRTISSINHYVATSLCTFENEQTYVHQLEVLFLKKIIDRTWIPPNVRPCVYVNVFVLLFVAHELRYQIVEKKRKMMKATEKSCCKGTGGR